MQRHYWENLILDDLDFQGHVDVVHGHSLEHGLMKCVSEGSYSFFLEMKTGTYLPDCCGDSESRVGGGGRHAYDYASLKSYLRELLDLDNSIYVGLELFTIERTCREETILKEARVYKK